MITVAIAALAVLFVLGGVIGVMRTEAELDSDIARFLLTIPADEWRESEK